MFFKRRIFRHNYVLLLEFFQVHKSGWITQRVWRFLKSTKWTDPPKRVKILSSPQEWTDHPKSVEVLKVHKVDGPPKRVKILSSPQKWTDHPKRVEVLKVHKVDGPPQRG